MKLLFAAAVMFSGFAVQASEIQSKVPSEVQANDLAYRPGRGVTCVARNLRGERFSAVGRNPRQASRLALRQCNSVSARCTLVRCF